MKTGGMMGVVVGKAAAVAKENDCSPRFVYQSFLPDLIELLDLPGNVRRSTLDDEFAVDPALPAFEEITRAEMLGGITADAIPGIVIDDSAATLTGAWNEHTGLKKFVVPHYLVSRQGEARFDFEIPEDGEWDIRMNWQPHESRATNTRVKIEVDGEVIAETTVDQTKPGGLPRGFHSLVTESLSKGQKGAVVVVGEGADAPVTVDAVQLIEVD
jgi:hypothetical protein